MKTKKIVALLMVVLLALSVCKPVCASEYVTVHQIEDLTWEEIKNFSFPESYTLVSTLVDELARIEDHSKDIPIDELHSHGYGGLNAETYEKQYPICIAIRDKFLKETKLNITITCDKYNTSYCGWNTYLDPSDIPNEKVIIGTYLTLNNGISYYESAWDWGSGKSALILDSNPNVKSGQIVKISAIAYLNNYGSVFRVVNRGFVTPTDNVMVLISINNEPIGWIAPYNLHF